MSKILIERDHDLGIDKAREFAKQWQADGEKDLGLQCTTSTTDAGDVIAFKAKGISGELTVRADKFVLEAKLGFLFSAFKEKIETKINGSLDKLLT